MSKHVRVWRRGSIAFTFSRLLAAMKILLVEDDSDTRRYIAESLNARGHAVDEASNGRDGLLCAMKEKHDVVILDRMLPVMDGLSVLRKLRERGVTTRVLMLTSLADVDSRIEGMEVGADDYLGKPFGVSELMARLNAITRRNASTAGATTILRIDDIEMDLITHRVSRAGQVIALNPREWDLLKYLVLHAGHVVTRSMLLEQIWGYQSSPLSGLVDTHICRLRSKIERDFIGPRLLRTVRGEGYILRGRYES